MFKLLESCGVSEEMDLSMGTLHMVSAKLIKLVIRFCFVEDRNVCQGHHKHTAAQRENYSSIGAPGTFVFPSPRS